MSFEVREGDCVSLMAAMPAGSVDAVVCDPPYGLEFMGKEWDRLLKAPSGSAHARQHSVSFVNPGNPTCRNCGGLKSLESEGSGGRIKCRCDDPDFPNHLLPRARAMQEWHQAWATEALRVLKPGGHLLAFGGTRTYHRLVCAVEDAGFEIRDTISWLYGSGFPKSLNVGAAIDKAAGAEREVVGFDPSRFRDDTNHNLTHYWPGRSGGTGNVDYEKKAQVTAPATPEAERWEGWGTALKPAHEPVVVARKPLQGTVASNVLTTGGYWVDVEDSESSGGSRREKVCNHCRDELSGLRRTDEGSAASDEAGEAAADLRAGVPREDDERREQPPLEGGSLDQRAGLRDCEPGRSGERPPGTPPGDGADHWSSAEDRRDGAPQGREQAEQPSKQPRATSGRGAGESHPAAHSSSCARCGGALHGTGALNVDGCRVGTDPGYSYERRGGRLIHAGGWDKDAPAESNPLGRWPANVVLSHTEGCVQVGTRKVKSSQPATFHRAAAENDGNTSAAYGKESRPEGHVTPGYGGADGTETVGAWSCTPGYRVPAFTLGGLSVALGISPEQEVEDLLALVLHRVRATDSHIAGIQTAPAREPSDDRWPSSPQGSPADCPACSRCGDVHARLTAAVGQASLPLLADVLETVLCPEWLSRRSRDSSPDDPSSSDGSVPSATSSGRTPSRTAEAQAAAASSVAQTPSDTTHTLRSPSPHAGSRGSTQPSRTSGAFGEARATACHIGHRCSGFLPLVSACLTSLRAYVPLSVEHIEWGGCPVRLLDEQTGETSSPNGPVRQGGHHRHDVGLEGDTREGFGIGYGDTGGASRFFYVAKASRGERNAGLEGFEEKAAGVHDDDAYVWPKNGDGSPRGKKVEPRANHHPTVKPISLMRWLVRLVTPPGGTVLDPFAGSGTTGCAAVLEGFDFIGLEREQEYVAIAEARIAWWHKHRGDGEAAEILAAGELRDEVEATGQLGMFD